MPATDRAPAPGTFLKLKVGGTWAIVIGVTAINGGEGVTEPIDTSEMYTTSATGPFVKTSQPGWLDSGELGVQANLTDQEYTTLKGLQDAGTVILAAIHTRTNSKALAGTAWIIGLGNDYPEGSTLAKMPFRLKWSGQTQWLTQTAADAL